MQKLILLISMIVTLFGFLSPSFAKVESEQEKISYLLDAVGSSGLIFSRNGRNYSATEAKNHLQEKANFMGLKIRTADDFIRMAGSRSWISGQPYLVHLPGGREESAEIWLRTQLAKME